MVSVKRARKDESKGSKNDIDEKESKTLSKRDSFETPRRTLEEWFL